MVFASSSAYFLRIFWDFFVSKICLGDHWIKLQLFFVFLLSEVTLLQHISKDISTSVEEWYREYVSATCHSQNQFSQKPPAHTRNKNTNLVFQSRQAGETKTQIMQGSQTCYSPNCPPKSFRLSRWAPTN